MQSVKRELEYEDPADEKVELPANVIESTAK
jgi:hypothetical protein